MSTDINKNDLCNSKFKAKSQQCFCIDIPEIGSCGSADVLEVSLIPNLVEESQVLEIISIPNDNPVKFN